MSQGIASPRPLVAPLTKAWYTALISSPAYPLAVQGVFYVATGIWPLVSISTFQQVTGPKTDLWLVHTVGLLIMVIGATLLTGACHRGMAKAVSILGIGSATALLAIDVLYVARQVIAPIYLLDAAAELLLIVWLAVTYVRTDRHGPAPSSH